MREVRYDRPEDLAAAVASAIAHDLRLALQAQQNDAVLVVPGGTTPAPIFLRLRVQALVWRRVIVLPSDERWVHPPHPDSNETLIRENLLKNKAELAQYRTLYRPVPLPSEAAPDLDRELEALPNGSPVVMLGMGEDGHFASLFPGVKGLNQGLDLDNAQCCLALDQPQKDYPRMSLTLAFLCRARRIFLVFKGDKKRRLIDVPQGLPIAALLAQNRAQVEIHWMGAV